MEPVYECVSLITSGTIINVVYALELSSTSI